MDLCVVGEKNPGHCREVDVIDRALLVEVALNCHSPPGWDTSPLLETPLPPRFCQVALTVTNTTFLKFLVERGTVRTAQEQTTRTQSLNLNLPIQSRANVSNN